MGGLGWLKQNYCDDFYIVTEEGTRDNSKICLMNFFQEVRVARAIKATLWIRPCEYAPKPSTSLNYFGDLIDEHLTWNHHIN